MSHNSHPQKVPDQGQSLLFCGPVYHFFPLGVLGAPHEQAPAAEPVAADAPENIRAVAQWIPHLQQLGVQAVLLGPIFSSASHGYDTLDLYRIDPRLGSNSDFAALSAEIHDAGISVLLDAVFNHVGRGFFAFQDVLQHRERSTYCSWFSELRFDRPGPAGDGVDYATWDGHGDLVKLNLNEPDARRYVLDAAAQWIEEFDIDGVRLDAADVIDPSLWPDLRRVVDDRYRGHRPFGQGRFWLNGEMVHGDYAAICGPDKLDGTTNYEVYKGLYSSHNDRNYHEIAHSLQRQFAAGGIYRGLSLLSFADNHDVPRIASTLTDPRHLYPLHILLFTIPGTPAIYYGSEVGVTGTKGDDDWPLRPQLTPQTLSRRGSHPDLQAAIIHLSALRRSVVELAGGDYTPLSVSNEQIVFRRGTTVVAVNAADQDVQVEIPHGTYRDALNQDEEVIGGPEVPVPPMWGRVLVPR
ncbi:MAG: alpha-amylase family glycosyl hydrolase [Alkalispirochaeta sp.]